MRIRSDRLYRLPIPRHEIWRRITVVDDYQTWWPWLRSLDAVRLAAGEVWRCTLRPPMPYAIRCDIHFERVDHTLIAALITGDLVGHARIELLDQPPGTDVRVVSELAASGWSIRLVARALPALARRAHDWILDTGARRFTTSTTVPA
jgi:hypothetical protein